MQLYRVKQSGEESQDSLNSFLLLEKDRIHFIQIFWDLISVLVTSHIQNRNHDPLLMDINHLREFFYKLMESGFERKDF